MQATLNDVMQEIQILL